MKHYLIQTLCMTGLALAPLAGNAQQPATPAAATTDTTTTTTITTETPSGTATSVRTSNDNEAANQLLRNPEELFRRLDANADGVLSMTEFQRVAALADGATMGRPSASSVPGTAPGSPMPSADSRVSPAPATGTAPGTNLGTPSR
jgi:hypothetical protein